MSGVMHHKYPRTPHLPWSPGGTDDDRVIPSHAGFRDREVVVTVKYDGENTTLYRDGMHARSLDYTRHPSRSRMRSLHAQVAHKIPGGWRICGENLFAKHSIHYMHLPGYFMMFSVWSDQNVCLSWDATREYSRHLGIPLVPELYRGAFDEGYLRTLYRTTHAGDPCEGFVLRIADAFPYKQFGTVVAKYVRQDHVQTDDHWSHGAVVPNHLCSSAVLDT